MTPDGVVIVEPPDSPFCLFVKIRIFLAESKFTDGKLSEASWCPFDFPPDGFLLPYSCNTPLGA
jgi:hypothetical protein